MKKIFLLLAVVFLVACGSGEPERFVPPEDEYIFAPVPENEYMPVVENLSEEAWNWLIYWSPNANTPETFFWGAPGGSMFYPEAAHIIDELLDGLLFDEMGFPFHYELFQRTDVHYIFDPGGHYIFDADLQEIGAIRVWFEDEAPVRVEILTVEEFEEREGFFESVEAAADAFGAEFRLPTVHMEIYGEPLIAPIHASWWGESDRLLVIYEAEELADVIEGWRRNGVLIIYIDHFDGDVEYIIETYMSHLNLEPHGIADTIVYRLFHEDNGVVDRFIWEHNGLLYFFDTPHGFCGTYFEPIVLFTLEEIFGLIGSMVW